MSKITKRSGHIEEFRWKKIELSMRRAGITEQTARLVATGIIHHDGITTLEVRNCVISAIKNKESQVTNRYESYTRKLHTEKMAHAQILSTGGIKTEKSVKRVKFEDDTFPHLDALWRTARWLTMLDSLAENLVLNTMTQAYRESLDSSDPVGVKARLFRILTREFFGCGKQRRSCDQPGALSENVKSTASSEWRIPPDTISAIEYSQLSRLNMMSDVSVMEAITRLRPRSRLMMILLFCELFSYADIAYITDLSRNSVRTILIRLRTVIIKYILENSDYFNKEDSSQSAFPVNRTESDSDYKSVSLHEPFIFPQEASVNCSFDSLENEGGADTILK